MNTRKHRCPLFLAGVFLVLTALACNLPGLATTTEIPPTPTASQGGEASPTQPSPPAATDTPAPDISGPGGCTLNARYVADVTIPDDTQFAPGEAFTKVWRVRNSGTCTWEAGTQLAFVSGEQMDGPVTVDVPSVAPGSNTDVSVDLVAPATPGDYRGIWQLQSPDGVRFGSQVYIQIVVLSPPTDTPTPTVTPTVTATATSTTPGPCVTPNADLKPILDHAEDLGYDMGCPTAPAFSVQGAFQEFWTNVDDPNPHTHYRSLMIWRSDNRDIYVIVGQDTDASEGMLLAYTDFWEQGMPEIPPDCAGMAVPIGYELPTRGFGKTWCENDLVDDVGWPTEHETEVTLLVQPMQTGLLLEVSGPIPIWYLVALDYQAVHAVTMMTGP